MYCRCPLGAMAEEEAMAADTAAAMGVAAVAAVAAVGTAVGMAAVGGQPPEVHDHVRALAGCLSSRPSLLSPLGPWLSCIKAVTPSLPFSDAFVPVCSLHNLMTYSQSLAC